VKHVLRNTNEHKMKRALVKMGGNEEEVEIDIEKLDTGTLRQLQKFVRETLRIEKKKAIREATV